MSLSNNPSQYEVVKAIKDLENQPSGSATDVQINSTSITSGGVANIVTNSAYNASSNKIATMSDLPTNKAAASGGTDVSLVTTGEKYTWNNKANTNQTYTRVFKSVADLGLTAPASITDVVYAFISNQYTNCLFLITNDNSNNVTGTPEGYGSLFIETASNYLRPQITYVKQVGDSVANTSPVAFKQWTANVIRGTNNIVTGVEWFEIMTDKQVSNPNLFINSNFRIDQRQGMVVYSGKLAYNNPNVSSSNAQIRNIVSTKTYSNTVRYARNVNIGETTMSSSSSYTLEFKPSAKPTVYRNTRAGIQWDITDAVSWDGNRTISDLVGGSQFLSFEFYYTTASDQTVYVKTSDCSRGYLGDGTYTGYLTFDDWKFGGDGVSLITPLTNGGIHWERRQVGTYINLEQVVEYLPAGTYIFTAWVSDTSKLNQSFCYYDGNYPLNTKIYDDGTKVVNRIILSTDCYNIHFGLQLKETSGNTLDVYKVKLEAGSVATEYTVPNPEEELAKCQRYFYRTKLMVGVGQFLETQKANIVVSLPVAMRVKPSVSWKGTWYIRCNGTWYLTVSSLVGVNGDAEQAIYEIQVNTNSAGTVGAVCDSFVQNGYVDFSADL